MPPRKLILIAVALAALLTPGLVACGGSSGAATDGPLGGAAGGGGICAPGRIGQPITLGLERFKNNGKRTLTFDRVRLRDPHGLRLVGSYAAPGVSWLVGTGFSWPPRSTKGFPLPPTWKHRQLVHGFRLAPGKSVNMVLGVAATTTPRGYTPGMEIWYHDPAGRYVLIDHFSLAIHTNPRRC